MQGYDIHIALGDNKLAVVSVLCEIQCKDAVALFINERVRSVYVFRLRVIEHSAAERYDIAARVDYRKHHAVAEVVVIRYFSVFVAAAQEIRALEQNIVKALFVEVIFKRAPIVRGKAQAEVADSLHSQPAVKEIVESMSASVGKELRVKKLRRRAVRRQNGGALFGEGIVIAVLRQSHSRSVRKLLDRLHIVEIFHSAHESYHIAADSAAEAIEAPVFGINGKRRGLFVVERAESDKVLAPSAQVDIGRNNALYIRICAQLFEKTVAESHPFSPLSIIYTQKILFSLQSYQKI